MTLDQIPLSVSFRIESVDWDALVPEEGQRLRALGIDAGARVKLAYRGVFLTRDPLAIEIGRMTVALRRVHAQAMTVSPVTVSPVTVEPAVVEPLAEAVA